MNMEVNIQDYTQLIQNPGDKLRPVKAKVIL